MKNQTRKLVALLSLLSVFAGITACNTPAGAPLSTSWESEFEKHICTADTLEINNDLILTDREQINEVVELITIDTSKQGFVCDCLGGRWFTFKNGTNTLASLRFHHGTMIEWRELWDSDYGYVFMTPESAHKIETWFSHKNIKMDK